MRIPVTEGFIASCYLGDVRNVVALVRVSSEEQAAEGLGGIERQWRDINGICSRESLAIVERISLEGVSGSTVTLHSDFQRMLGLVRRRDIAGLVISSPDRLMRCADMSDFAHLKVFGDPAAPRMIWTADSAYDLSKFDSQLTFLMRALMGGNEKKQIIARTQSGKNISRERPDKQADPCPLGVEFMITDARYRTGFYRYTPESAKVLAAFRRVLDQDVSFQALAKELGFGSYQMMRKLLANPIYIGIRESRWRREKLPAGANGELRYRRVLRDAPIRARILLESEPLISEQMFEQVQAVLANTRREYVMSRHSREDSIFELSGLLRCKCGKRYYSKHGRNAKSDGYYICASGYIDANKRCGAPHLSRRETDEAVIEMLSKSMANEETLTALIVNALTPEDLPALETEQRQILKDIEVLQKRRGILIEKISEGIISDDECKIPLAKIRSQLETKSERIQKLEQQIVSTVIPDLASIVLEIAQLFARAKLHDRVSRKALIRQLVTEIHMQDGRPDKINLRLNALDLSDTTGEDRSKLVSRRGRDSWLPPA